MTQLSIYTYIKQKGLLTKPLSCGKLTLKVLTSIANQLHIENSAPVDALFLTDHRQETYIRYFGKTSHRLAFSNDFYSIDDSDQKSIPVKVDKRD